MTNLKACIVLCLALTTTAVKVSFDYGWRFQQYDPPSTPSQCEFDNKLTGLICNEDGTNLQYTPQGRLVAEDCQLACCSWHNCTGYAFSVSKWHSQCFLSFTGKPDCYKPSGSDKPTVLQGGMCTKRLPFPQDYAYSHASYDDSDWAIIDVPHDSIINGTYAPQYDNHHASLPRNVSWYRKHFKLPEEWQGQGATYIHFDAIFHVVAVWINDVYLGEFHSGYIPIRLSLRNVSGLNYGEQENVIAMRADASFGSGHWYEGGGIYRNSYLIHKPFPLHIAQDGVFAPAEGNGSTFKPSMEITSHFAATKTVQANFMLYDKDELVTFCHATDNVTDGTILQADCSFTNAKLWSVRNPHLYTLYVTLEHQGQIVDSEKLSVGFRSTEWTADNGLLINNERTHLRGFCHHEDFGGVGVAVSPRINLYRLQALRAVGGNSFRTSHNPYGPVNYDIMDRLGVVVWDETRDYTPWQIADMTTMVKRDRSHPSVFIWSFCNEIECHLDQPGEHGVQYAFRNAVLKVDSTRPLSANIAMSVDDAAVEQSMDVHGQSHGQSSTIYQWHKDHPDQAQVSSECCSCTTNRGENSITNTTYQRTNFDGACLQQQVADTDNITFLAGTMGVWTLFDYYGEPTTWPAVSSSFGQFDLIGVPKAHAHWYRSWWLCKIQQSDAGRPFADPCEEVHIVQAWDPHDPPSTVNVFASTPKVELMINSKSQGVQTVPYYGFAEYKVTFEAGEIIAYGIDANGQRVINHTRHSSSSVAALSLHLDAPSETTGTGYAVYADGHDTALVRAQLVDAQGVVVHSANDTVVFNVVSGPGRVVGVGNGDPSCHEPNQVNHRSAYHGVARAVVRVTMDCVSPHRNLLASVDVDGGHMTTVASNCSGLEDIVVEATAGGVSARITIPVSGEDAAGVLAVAAEQPSSFHFFSGYSAL